MYQALYDTTRNKRTHGPCFHAACGIAGKQLTSIFLNLYSSCYFSDLGEYANDCIFSWIDCSLLFSLLKFQGPLTVPIAIL